jgi:hypothetical protein
VLQIIFLFIVSIFYLFHPAPAFAADCGQVFLEPASTIAGDYSGKITISTAQDCFGAEAEYTIIAAPKSTDDTINLFGDSLYAEQGIVKNKIKPDSSDPKKIISAEFNFNSRTIPKDDTWIIKVCLATNSVNRNCTAKKPENTLLRASFQVTANNKSVLTNPSGTSSPSIDLTNLPTINIEKQQCTFQYGSAEPILIYVQNTVPGKFYNWESGDSSGTLNAGDEGAIYFTIPNPDEPNSRIKTSGPGETRFCIDQLEYNMRRVADKNCVTLSFTPTAPEESKKACDPVTRGPKNEKCGADKVAYCAKQSGTTICPTPDSCVCSKGECVAKTRPAGQIGTQYGCKEREIKTALGCIPIDANPLIAGLMKYVVGLSGGIALLMMIFGSFQMVTSAGNAESVKKGRDQFVSAVIGLLFVIFSVLLMQIIGVDILGLPGFS